MSEFNFLICLSSLAEVTAALSYVYFANDLATSHYHYPQTIEIYINAITSCFLFLTSFMGFLLLFKKSKRLSLLASLSAIVSFVVVLLAIVLFWVLYSHISVPEFDYSFDFWFAVAVVIILPTPTYIFYRFWEFLKFNYDEEEDGLRKSSLSSDLIVSAAALAVRQSVNIDKFRTNLSEFPDDIEVNEKF